MIHIFCVIIWIGSYVLSLTWWYNNLHALHGCIEIIFGFALILTAYRTVATQAYIPVTTSFFAIFASL